jgi:hypothetical protein
MNEPPEIEPLATNLARFVLDHEASFALVAVKSRRASPEPENGTEVGTVELELRDALRAIAKPLPAVFQVPFRRVLDPRMRIHNRADQWNALGLETGELVLFGLKPTANPNEFAALAGHPVESAQDPAVGALREAVRIEALEPTARVRRFPLQDAIASPEFILRDYAALSLRTGLLPRDDAVAVLEAGIRRAPTPNDALSLADEITGPHYFLWDAWADRTNARIVGAVASGLARALPKQRFAWTQYLSSCTMGKFSPDAAQSARVRRALLLEVDAETTAGGLAALDALLAESPEPQRAFARRIADTWRSIQDVPLEK